MNVSPPPVQPTWKTAQHVHFYGTEVPTYQVEPHHPATKVPPCVRTQSAVPWVPSTTHHPSWYHLHNHSIPTIKTSVEIDPMEHNHSWINTETVPRWSTPKRLTVNSTVSYSTKTCGPERIHSTSQFLLLIPSTTMNSGPLFLHSSSHVSTITSTSTPG